MKLDNMFKKNRGTSMKRIAHRQAGPEVPEGLMRKCNQCGKAIIAEDAEQGYYICPKCGGYFHVPAYRRLDMILDEGSFQEWNETMPEQNPMEYRGYPEKLAAMKARTGLDEAVVTGKGSIHGTETVIGVCDGRFLMASMGENVGEKIACAVERATEEQLPVILFCCSGGARMQEGITSLMQMAKTSAALKRHSDAGLLYISVLTDPTTGGVTASFAMLGDIILAEPGALIGFAGPRVIEQTIRQKLPKGFQRAEFLLEHGFLDAIVERSRMQKVLGNLLQMHGKAAWEEQSQEAAELKSSEDRTERSHVSVQKKEAWDRVLLSRKKDRPVGSDYIQALFTNFQEFHGDRLYGDDSAIIGGIASFGDRAVTVIAQEKGRSTRENIQRNFAMPKPDGYRKALRLMKQAEKFHRPVICFVDTPGAFCGIEAEERGQGEAIARNIYEMSALKVPILTVIIGEGGSGGALALATSDEVWMLENAIYSILSPEGFASILWKDSTKAKEAAKVMKLTSDCLKEQGIVDNVISEPEGFSRENLYLVTGPMEEEIKRFLNQYGNMLEEELTEHRYQRFRKM
ncbi:Acetyl-coenzyme A carboxylase carboxyl transferase subunit beta [uncultured Clostridium sp.]|uniref:Multifunctional fusion protein n=1 Tax=Muricoprocola aceti TaxID=2981772 RepID=A0ABT2SL93_9FIRM|nr:acetyl-CoA carboxylase carboxyltransferase subunit alpha [Muricoprocola aceti]MCU6725070.1 acetyl-CoA carboxylase carboxyltransferase subunit alpha [Muricoprocola aceti]SCH37196.1 Acetyl-coenzyme A carboxylase carboxyl transferase subunit beta [uncultured Clostridium sp.]